MKPRIQGRRARTLQAWAACLAAAIAAGAQMPAQAQAQAPDCDLDYRVTARPDLQPAVLEVELRYAAGGRRESVLRAVPAWAGVSDFAASYGDWQALGEGQSVQAMDEPHRWRVQHGPDDLVRLRWRVRSAMADPEQVKPQDQAQMYRSQIGPRGFQFFGYGLFPSVEHWDDNTAPRLCLTLQPFSADSVVFGSGGRAAPGQALHWAERGSPALLRHAFFAGGPMWRLQQRAVLGGTLNLAVRGEFAKLDDVAFADASARLIDTQRRFWEPALAAPAQPPQWLVLTPNHVPSGSSGGTLVRQTAVLHAPQDFSPSSGVFEFLVAHENLHQWFPQRFGGHDRAEPPRNAEAYWFSEGFTDHYSYRLLLASGLWSLEHYAAQLTERARRYLGSPARNLTAAQIAPRFFSDREAGRQMYVRGELLALRWDAALRRAGRGSLTHLLQGLQLPSGSAATAASEPAAARVLEALAQRLAGTGVDPRADLQRYLTQGEPMPLASAEWDASMGPCLLRDEEAVPIWQLGFDRESFKTRVLQGVEPEGPAYAAGLRDGMALAGFSVYGGDVTRDAQLQIREPAAEGEPARLRTVSYRPVSPQSQRQPRWQARPDAARDPACQAWVQAR